MSSPTLIDLNRHYHHWQIMMRYLKMTSNQDWRYDEERLKLRSQCIRVLLSKLGTVKIDEKLNLIVHRTSMNVRYLGLSR